MSKISISVETAIPKEAQNSKLVFALHKSIRQPIQNIKDILSQGQESYLYRTELFMNNHVEVDNEIREILNILEQFQVVPYILEFIYKNDCVDPIDKDLCHISKQELLNILNDSGGNYE